MTRKTNSPAKYIQGKNELLQLGQYIKSLESKKAYILIDAFLFDSFKDKVENSCKEATIEGKAFKFGGESSLNEVKRIEQEVRNNDYDVVVGVGGGKTLDTAKAVSHFTHNPVIIAPTAASSDAPCSALSVLYTDNGEFDQYLFLKKSPDIVMVDTQVIANAPARLLLAGIGDALATYYEARACFKSNANTTAGW